MKFADIIVADYSADNQQSYLAYLDDLSRKREDGGLLHGGHIHFIQGKLSDEDGSPFLKAAIAGILDRVPSQIPYNLPELIKQESFEPSESLNKAYQEVNAGLIMPVEGYDLVRVILAAREYEALGETRQ